MELNSMKKKLLNYIQSLQVNVINWKKNLKKNLVRGLLMKELDVMNSILKLKLWTSILTHEGTLQRGSRSYEDGNHESLRQQAKLKLMRLFSIS